MFAFSEFFDHFRAECVEVLWLAAGTRIPGAFTRYAHSNNRVYNHCQANRCWEPIR